MADRYWNPAGAANWGDANVWAETDGGDPTGIATPTASDDVYFTSTNVNNCTVGANAYCLSLDFSGGTGYSGTLGGSSRIEIIGNVTLDSAMTVTNSNRLEFKPAFGDTAVFTSDGVTISMYVNLSTTGTLQLADALNTTGSNGININNGIFDSNEQTITCSGGEIDIGALCTGLDLTNSTITCKGWDWGTSVIVPTVVGSTIIVIGTGQFDGGGRTYNDVTLTGSAHIVSGSNTFANLTRTGNASKTDYIKFTGGTTQTITGTFTVNGNSAINRIWMFSTSMGTGYTINAGTVACNAVDIQDCTGAGAGDWDLSLAADYTGDLGGNTNITFTTADELFWVNTDGGNWSDTTSWSTSSGGASGARVPLAQDTCTFDANSFAADGKTVNQDMPRIGGTSFADTDQAFTFNHSAQARVYGDMTLDTNVTLDGLSTDYNFEGRGAHTLTNAGKTWDVDVLIDCADGSLTLADDIIVDTDKRLAFVSGTFDANDFNVTSKFFDFDSTIAHTVNMGSGTWTASGTGTVWDASPSSGLTLNAETSTIKFTDTSNTAITMYAGTSLTYNNVWFDRGSSTGTNTINATTDLTFAEFKDTGTEAHTIIFPNITTTVTSMDVNGSSGKLITLQRTGASGSWTISDTAGENTVTYCDISNSTAEGGATWNAGAGCVDGGGNTGWIFSGGSTTKNALLLGIG